MTRDERLKELIKYLMAAGNSEPDARRKAEYLLNNAPKEVME